MKIIKFEDDKTKNLKNWKKNWSVLIFESSYLPATYNHEVLALDISTDCPLLSSLPLPCQVTSAVSVPFLPNTTPKMRKKKYTYKEKNYEQNRAKSFLKSDLNSSQFIYFHEILSELPPDQRSHENWNISCKYDTYSIGDSTQKLSFMLAQNF